MFIKVLNEDGNLVGLNTKCIKELYVDMLVFDKDTISFNSVFIDKDNKEFNGLGVISDMNLQLLYLFKEEEDMRIKAQEYFTYRLIDNLHNYGYFNNIDEQLLREIINNCEYEKYEEEERIRAIYSEHQRERAYARLRR